MLHLNYDNNYHKKTHYYSSYTLFVYNYLLTIKLYNNKKEWLAEVFIN